MNRFAKLDHQYVWHPFTQMRDWLRRPPIVIAEAHGAVLRDTAGREYLDANSSIWTNLHGHRHPKIDAAIEQQLKKIAHSSALGLANIPAPLLADRLLRLAHLTPFATRSQRALRPGLANPKLTKVFFSDDGSTAMEVALKLAYESTRRSGRARKPRFLSLGGAYHGDTVGAVSLGHIDLFHKSYSGLLFHTDQAMAPYCYRCPFNRAKPERADARAYRRCNWECVDKFELQFRKQKAKGQPYSAFVFEPLIQGAAGMIPQPTGWLGRVARIARQHGALLIADEVMTAFGRTGVPDPSSRTLGTQPTDSPLFASHLEGVQPDLLAVAKGLTGGYMPMAATLTTQSIFNAFLGEYHEFKTFVHGHSYSANQLGAAAALASLDLLTAPSAVSSRAQLQTHFREELQTLWVNPHVGDIRQVGLIAGVELVRNWPTREPFDLREQVGVRVCDAMARKGVLTRPVGNVIVLMPPYCTTRPQLQTMVAALHHALRQALGQ